LKTVPSLSLVVAVTVTFAGATKTALFAGAVRFTPGGASTRIVTAAVVVATPRLSVALAVIVCVPVADSRGNPRRPALRPIDEGLPRRIDARLPPLPRRIPLPFDEGKVKDMPLSLRREEVESILAEKG
jgi:hypothetical protein